MIAYVTMGMAVAPMIAPTIGGVLETFFGWRASFAFLIGFGGLALVFAYWRLRETNHSRASGESARELLRGYGSLFRSRQFWGYTLVTSFVSAMFFAFLAGAPYVMIELLGRSPAEYGFYFAMVPSGYILGNFATGRIAGRMGPNRMILAGTLLFGPMLFIGVANGLVLPSGIAGAVSVRSDLAGAAAGLSGSFQIGFGALVAPIVGATLSSTVWPLIAIMTICSSLAIASLALVATRRMPAAGN
jgi:DHA1 family bicyclomycin/chloramphenicol resistance-like MFS transporter